MSRLQAIESALQNINEAAFQNLCDSFLSINNRNYSSFSRLGSSIGSQKTAKGTPDALILLPNGKYILVEYSTNISKGFKKIVDDIRKCLDPHKSHVSPSEIMEIIVCVNFRLKTVELEQIKQELNNTRIKLTIHTLDSLSLELHLNHRDLVYFYLGLPIDTGQVLSIESFTKEYDQAANGIATSLSYPFVHRMAETENILKHLKSNDLIILTGAAGVGKTKLALEAIRIFLKDNLDFGAYCISYKSSPLLEDLYLYLKPENNYILFVDDANRIDAFNQITGFYKANRTGRLKIIITVRDYAYEEIGLLTYQYAPIRIEIDKFKDEQIRDLIKAKPLEILNQEFQEEILRIADGNPRLAIMASLLAKAKQDLYALSDVSNLFDSYFSNLILDKGELANPTTIKYLGIISFFYTLPYKDLEIVKNILSDFNLDYSDFYDSISKLERLELIEIQYEHVKVSEQNLSTYFFYRCFIKDKLLPFEILLEKYFSRNKVRFSDTVIAANNAFGPAKVMQSLTPALKASWRNIEGEVAYDFLSTFWFYLRDETLKFVYDEIHKYPKKTEEEYDLPFDRSKFNYERNKIIELLSNFFRDARYLKQVLQLLVELVKRVPTLASEFHYNLHERFTFDREDELNGYKRQNILYSILIEGVEKGDKLLAPLFFKLSKIFLGFQFRHAKSGRGRSITLYEYRLPATSQILKFRGQIWDTAYKQYGTYKDEILELLEAYTTPTSETEPTIFSYDLKQILLIIQHHLSSSNFTHCLFVNNLNFLTKRVTKKYQLNKLARDFTNSTYKTFVKLDWDRIKNRESFEFSDYKEFEHLKEKEIRNYFRFNNKHETEIFWQNFNFLKNVVKNNWGDNRTLDIIIEENAKLNFQIALHLISLIIKNDNEIGFVPFLLFKSELENKERHEDLWRNFENYSFKYKTQWEISYLTNLPLHFVQKKHALALIESIKNTNEALTLFIERWDKFYDVHRNFYIEVLYAIVNKNNIEKTGLKIWPDIFYNHFEKIENDIVIAKEAYIQQELINNHFDYEGKALLKLLNLDKGFLYEYCQQILNSIDHHNIWRNRHAMSFIWAIDGIESEMEKIFELAVVKCEYHGILEHFCNSFFYNLKEENKFKADAFIKTYVAKYFANTDKMNVIIDIVRHSRRELYNDIYLQFISLTQDVNLFREIMWRGNGGSYTGNVIIGDIQAAEWRNLLELTDQADGGIDLIPIKQYLNNQVESCLRSADWERKRRFLERDY